jgi:hypothetical protein
MAGSGVSDPKKTASANGSAPPDRDAAIIEQLETEAARQPQVVITVALANALLNYLADRPYREVFRFVQEIQAAPQAPVPQPPAEPAAELDVSDG